MGGKALGEATGGSHWKKPLGEKQWGKILGEATGRSNGKGTRRNYWEKQLEEDTGGSH